MIISPGVCFIFIKILIFQVVRGVKSQKAVQNDRKFCPLHPIFQEPYIIWMSFMVHICKIISSGAFFIFCKILIFWNYGVVKVQKRSRMTKFCLSCSISLEPYIIRLSCMVEMCKMIISPGVFFSVKIMIFQVVKELNLDFRDY